METPNPNSKPVPWAHAPHDLLAQEHWLRYRWLRLAELLQAHEAQHQITLPAQIWIDLYEEVGRLLQRHAQIETQWRAEIESYKPVEKLLLQRWLKERFADMDPWHKDFDAFVAILKTYADKWNRPGPTDAALPDPEVQTPSAALLAEEQYQLERWLRLYVQLEAFEKAVEKAGGPVFDLQVWGVMMDTVGPLDRGQPTDPPCFADGPDSLWEPCLRLNERWSKWFEQWFAAKCAERGLEDAEERRDFRLLFVNRWTRPWQKQLPMIAKDLDHYLWSGGADDFDDDDSEKTQRKPSGFAAWSQAMDNPDAQDAPPAGDSD